LASPSVHIMTFDPGWCAAMTVEISKAGPRAVDPCALNLCIRKITYVHFQYHNYLYIYLNL
jgi:hypothetical protein